MKATKKSDGVNRVSALHALARERIAGRLREAQRLVRRGVEENAGSLRDVMEDVIDRIDALAVVDAAVSKDDGPERPKTRTSCAFTAAFGKPVKEFLLIPFGDVEVERPLAGKSFHFSRTMAEAAVTWFEKLDRKLAIDYEHQSVEGLNGRADGLRPAAGWVGKLEVRDDGLWATSVEWTEKARALLLRGEYRYFSPVLYWADAEFQTLIGLGPVALTNDPAMHGVQALAAGRDVESGSAPSAEPGPLTGELQETRSQVAMLKQQLRQQEADAFIERGMRLGKITDATSMDWREDFLRDGVAAEQRLARTPVVLPPGRLIAGERPAGAARTAAGFPPVAMNGGLNGVEPEDLEAFERAVASGRVCIG